MSSILEELFYGNICPSTDCRSKNNESVKLMRYIADHYDNLEKTLNERQKEIFKKFNGCRDELTDINDRELFIYAFRLGVKITIEVLSFDSFERGLV